MGNLRIHFRAFFKKWFNFSNFATSWKGVEFDRKIPKLRIGQAKTPAQFF